MNKILFVMLFILASCSQQEEVRITILHTNDIHAKHEAMIRTNKISGEVSTNGGAAQLSTVLASEKKLNPNTIIVDSGDTLTGSAYTIVYKGLEAVDLMNMMGYDISTLGNHEFDFELEGAKNIINARSFPTISANVVETDSGSSIVPPYIITNIAGRKIAFIGLLTDEESFIHRTGSTNFIKVTEGVEALSNLFVQEPILNTLDSLILISHSGFKKDKQIAEAFPGKFDVIIGGHSHTLLTEPYIISNTPIVQLDNNLKRVGRLDLIFKGKTKKFLYKQILLENILPDPTIEQYLNSKREGVVSALGKKIGYLDTDSLDDDNIRCESKPLGNFISDLLLESFRESGVEIVLFNSGTIRSSLPRGNFTLQTAFELHPFDNTAYVVDLKGSVIQEILETSVQSNLGEGGFMQLSQGLSATYNKSNNKLDIMFNNQPLNPDQNYTVLVSDWLYGGGDGYSMIAEKSSNVRYKGNEFRDVLIDQFKIKKNVDDKSIDKKPRWKFVE